MEVRTNEKGRGVYANKEYQPWDIVYVERRIFAISSICNQDYIATAQRTKNSHQTGSFLNRMLSFIASAPDSKVKSQHAHLKFPLLYLREGGKLESMSHLARVPSLGVTDKQIRNVAKNFKVSRDDLKSIAQIVQANGFSIPGLFFTEIGMALFDKGSMFNHSCDPNAFTFITYDKLIVFARKSIAAGEEVTISYKPLCVPDIDQLLGFECKCGNCKGRDSTILKEVYNHFIEVQTIQERIDYLIDRAKEVPSAEFIQLLIESYYEIWAIGKTYREKDLYKVLQKFKFRAPDSTWIEAHLLALILASRLNFVDHIPKIHENIKTFLSNPDIIEHIIVTTTLIPHLYHNVLIDVLGKLNLLP